MGLELQASSVLYEEATDQFLVTVQKLSVQVEREYAQVGSKAEISKKFRDLAKVDRR